MQAQLDEIKVLVQKLQSPPPQPPAAAGPAAPPPASAAQPHSLEVNLALIQAARQDISSTERRHQGAGQRTTSRRWTARVNSKAEALDSNINEGYKAWTARSESRRWTARQQG